MNVKLKLSADGIGDFFRGMLDRARQIDGWLNRVAYPELLRYQAQRWKTQNANAGGTWKPVSEKYAKWKSKKYGAFPGGGRKTLIARGKLAYSMTLQSSLAASEAATKDDHYKLVAGNKLEMGSFVRYAKFVEAQGRDITSLSNEFTKDLAKRLGEYLTGIKKKSVW